MSVVATSGDQKLITSTDETRAYRLDLPVGEWQVSTELFSLRKAKQDPDPSATTSSLQWELVLPAPTDAGRRVRKPATAGVSNREPEAVQGIDATTPMTDTQPPDESAAGDRSW